MIAKHNGILNAPFSALDSHTSSPLQTSELSSSNHHTASAAYTPSATAVSSQSSLDPTRLVPWKSCNVNHDHRSRLGKGGQAIVLPGTVQFSDLPSELRIVTRNSSLPCQTGKIPVAFKLLSLQGNKHEIASAKARFEREIRSTLSFKSEYVVEGFGYTIDPANNMYLILRFYELGSLQNPKCELSCNDRIAIATDLALGVQYVHSHGLLHRDISPANVFLYRDPHTNRIRACLGDLGVIRGETSDVTTRVLTKGYSAPETIRDELHYSQESDIFSLSMTLLELFHRVEDNSPLSPIMALLLAGISDLPSNRCKLPDLLASILPVDRTLMQACAKLRSDDLRDQLSITMLLEEQIANKDRLISLQRQSMDQMIEVHCDEMNQLQLRLDEQQKLADVKREQNNRTIADLQAQVSTCQEELRSAQEREQAERDRDAAEIVKEEPKLSLVEIAALHHSHHPSAAMHVQRLSREELVAVDRILIRLRGW